MAERSSELRRRHLKRHYDDELSSNGLPRAKKHFELISHVSRFLNLPAELRNRIYEYAAEDVPSKPLRLVTRYKLGECHKLSGVALTQVCRQMRSEYRTIWLKRSKFVVEWHDVKPFMESFYPREDEYNGGPGELVVYYNLDFDHALKRPTDIMHLARIGLFFNDFKVCFTSEDVILEDDDDEDDDHDYHASRIISAFLNYGNLTFKKIQYNDATPVFDEQWKWRRDILDGKICEISVTYVDTLDKVEICVLLAQEAARACYGGGGDGDIAEKYYRITGLSKLKHGSHRVQVSISKYR